MVVKKDPFRISFQTLEGEVINEDDEGLGAGFLGDQITCHKRLQDWERFLGLGEKTGNVDKRGHGFTNWNTDTFAYDSSQDPIYSTFPFYIGLHNGRCYGLFMDNSFKSHFNFGASNHRFASFSAEGGDLNYYLFAGESIADIIEAYTWLTGRMEMLPKWSLGYQQCRYSYYPHHEISTLAKTFRDKQIPCDVVYHDIHYMQDYKLFTWNKDRFPDPKKAIEALREEGFHVVVIVDPGIKVEEAYEVYKDGLEQDVFIKYPDGELYKGDVWPGTCHFPDFTMEKGRQWWASKFGELVDQGVEGFWNDMNEIATWGNSLPNALTYDFDGHPTSSREARNVYGTQMARATRDGAASFIGNKRTFTITRGAYAGFQRYGILWTGDNVSSDEHMMLGARMLTSLGLTGMPFTGNDVGGFVGDANPALFARWMTIAAFQPFARGHSTINTMDHEPWSFGEEVEEISRNYLNVRYRLLPYFYSLLAEATRTGMPICRSLAFDFPFQPEVFDYRFQNQFLLGPYLMVAPVESTKEITKAYIPHGEWYDLHTGIKISGNQIIHVDCPLHRLPLYVKAGGMLLMQSLVQHTEEPSDGVLTLHLYRGDQSNPFDWYEDDGVTLDYQKGQFLNRKITFNGQNALRIEKTQGEWKSEFKRLRLTLHGYDHAADLVKNGDEILSFTRRDDFSYFQPLSSFDPFEVEATVERSVVYEVELDLSPEVNEMNWTI